MATALLLALARCKSPDVGQEFALGTEEGTMILMAIVSVVGTCLGLGSAECVKLCSAKHCVPAIYIVFGFAKWLVTGEAKCFEPYHNLST